MNVTIPLYIEEEKRRPGEAAPRHTVRPLFFTRPTQSDELLSRATTRLAGELRKLLDSHGRRLRHDALAEWSFAPPLQEHHLSLTLHLRRTTVQCRPTVATFESLGRTIALVPTLGDFWFDVTEGQRLDDRATEVLAAYLRRFERESRSEIDIPFGLSARAWLSSIELNVSTNQIKKRSVPRFLSLGAPALASGREELEKVGRCLDWLYPDELDRVILRDSEVDELTRLLTDIDRRPVLLVGPRMVGKTAIIHEHVFRKVEARGKNAYPSKHNLWLIAPQRLISGMSFVGQWEARLLAILDEAKRNDHVLYFDDLLGLFFAGLTSESELSVVHVLRPYIERRDVRVLAEMTPQSLRVLRERDRGLADLLHVLPVAELPARENRRILIESMRQLEGRHRCRFEIDALPTATDLLERYARDAVMPGKAAAMFRRLSVKLPGQPIRRDTVLTEFHATSGLAVRFLDDHQRLPRREIVEALSRELIGQDHSVQAMADVVGVARARLNETTRPLASLLFTGPTGVGKTQAAKALASYLFGDAERLVRFDMNEYVDYSAAARLVGDALRPDGLLTAAVRRQPFAVLLFDEIEKAHPDVFDLLLQVIGEARLTDALGRTADFANTIIVFTSNLGVREASSSFGLRPGSAGAAADARRDRAFVDAAERFFRPEFFNRIDRVIPFRPLGRPEVARIATRLIRDVFARDGLLQRRCILRVEVDAMERIVDQGFHPELGARALKRAVERQLTRPIATRLATMPPGTPTVINVVPNGDRIAVQTQALSAVTRLTPDIVRASDDPEELLDRLSDAIERIERDVAVHQPGAVITQGQLGSAHFRYFVVREQAERVRRMVNHAYDRLDAPRRTRVVATSRATPRVPRPVALRSVSATDSDAHAVWRAFVAAEQVNTYLAELTRSSQPLDGDGENPVGYLVREAALLDAMASADASGARDRVILHIRGLSDARTEKQVALAELYASLFDRQHGFTSARVEPSTDDATVFGASADLLFLEMPGIADLLHGEAGTHLFLQPDGGLVPIQVMLAPLAPDESLSDATAAHARRRHHWLEQLAAARGDAADADPWALGPVVRIYGQDGHTLDLRTGVMAERTLPTSSDVRTFVCAALRPPRELTEED